MQRRTTGLISSDAALSVRERVAVGVNVYQAIRLEGEVELARPVAALAWSAFTTGLSMGFSFVAEALLRTRLPQTSWTPLITKPGYSLGFLIVVLGRQQLFTENTLTVVLPVLLHKSWKVLLRVARLWGIVLSVNLLGTCIFAFCVAYSSILDPQTKAAFYAIGSAHVGIGFGTVFLRAIFAGWLITLMVWLLPGAEHARVATIIDANWTSVQSIKGANVLGVNNPAFVAWALAHGAVEKPQQ